MQKRAQAHSWHASGALHEQLRAAPRRGPLTQAALCAGVFFVPAFSGLLAPHWRADARGAILGLTGSSSAAHVARALLDALAWQVGFRARVLGYPQPKA